MNLTLISYCGTRNIGVNVDTAAVPDPEAVVASFHEGFPEVLALAAPLPSRHGPTRKRRAAGSRRVAVAAG